MKAAERHFLDVHDRCHEGCGETVGYRRRTNMSTLATSCTELCPPRQQHGELPRCQGGYG